MSLLDLPVPKEFSRSLIHAAARHGIGILPVVRQLKLYDESVQMVTVGDVYELISFLFEQGEFYSFLPILSDIELSGIEEMVTLSMASPSLRGTLNQLIQLGILQQYGIHLTLIDSQQDHRLRCEVDSGLPEPLRRTIVDSAFCMFRRIIVPLLGVDGPILGVCLAETSSDFLSDYEVYFSVPIATGCDCNELVLKPGVFDFSISSSCPELEQQALKSLAEKAQLLNRQQSVVSQISVWLNGLDTLNEIEIGDAAAYMGVAVRSLQKKLSDHDTTFSKIKMQCLIERSKTLLRNPQLSVDAIAEKIGFSDATSFRRAFKRVEGISPTQYRKPWVV